MRKRQPVIIRRFTRGDEEWAIRDDGHYLVLRAGDLEPEAVVTTRDRRCSDRRGVVQALLPGWAGAITVAVRWRPLEGTRTPGPFWRRDELKIVRKAR